jgi:hypothetical protein
MEPTTERATLSPADERYREVLDRRFNNSHHRPGDRGID